MRKGRQHITQSVVHLLSSTFKKPSTATKKQSVSCDAGGNGEMMAEEALTSEDCLGRLVLCSDIVADVATGVTGSLKTSYQQSTNLTGCVCV